MRDIIKRFLIVFALCLTGCSSAASSASAADSKAEEAEKTEEADQPKETGQPIITPTTPESLKDVTVYGAVFHVPESWYTTETEGKQYIVKNADKTSLVRFGIYPVDDVSFIDGAYDDLRDSLAENWGTIDEEPFNGGYKFSYMTDSSNGTPTVPTQLYAFPVNKNTVFFIATAFNLEFDSYILEADYSNVVYEGKEKPAEEETTPEPTPEPTEEPAPSGALTMENFLAIRQGMSLAEVNQLLGSEGSLDSSTDIMGIKSETYSWGETLMGITCSFSDGKLDAKYQVSLGQSAPAPTKEQYDQCSTGMSYEQIAAIIGEGELQSVVWLLGTETSIYSWTSGLKMVTMTFMNGKLSGMSQYGLD